MTKTFLGNNDLKLLILGKCKRDYDIKLANDQEGDHMKWAGSNKTQAAHLLNQYNVLIIILNHSRLREMSNHMLFRQTTLSDINGENEKVKRKFVQRMLFHTKSSIILILLLETWSVVLHQFAVLSRAGKSHKHAHQDRLSDCIFFPTLYVLVPSLNITKLPRVPCVE